MRDTTNGLRRMLDFGAVTEFSQGDSVISYTFGLVLYFFDLFNLFLLFDECVAHISDDFIS